MIASKIMIGLLISYSLEATQEEESYSIQHMISSIGIKGLTER